MGHFFSIEFDRRFIPMEILKEGKKIGVGGKLHAQIVEFKNCFLISDNPVLFPQTPININHFQNSLIFPISKNRALFLLEAENYTIDSQSIKMINLLLIHQANRYIGFYNKEMLEGFVRGYRHFKNIGEHTTELKKKLFARINLLTTETFIPD